MPIPLRFLFASSACLIGGFVVGRYSKPGRSVAGIGQPVAPGQAIASAVASPVSSSPPIVGTKPAEVDYLGNRQATLVWMKNQNRSFTTHPFNPQGVDLTLALILGLAPEEMEELNAAYRSTKTSLDELAIRAANSQVSADGRKLVVTVPSLAGGSAPLYTSLLDTFRRVLGPERFPLFNQFAGEGFDQSFDRFGLNPVTYELTLQPEAAAGTTPLYPIRISYADAAIKGTGGWTTGIATRDSLEKTHPVVAHFLGTTIGK